MKSIPIISTNDSFSINLLPVECPYCHMRQIPDILCALEYDRNTRESIIASKCTNSKCCRIYLYSHDEIKKESHNLSVAEPSKMNFEQVIHDISDNFCTIYNEAYAAEQMNLEYICGVGYRKALEFLIKDYIKSNNPEKEDEIKKKALGKCIDEYINNYNIKAVARRAVWLGNDETHYVRKWESKDIKDLKSLIQLSVHWIMDEIKTAEILKDMPENI